MSVHLFVQQDLRYGESGSHSTRKIYSNHFVSMAGVMTMPLFHNETPSKYFRHNISPRPSRACYSLYSGRKPATCVSPSVTSPLPFCTCAEIPTLWRRTESIPCFGVSRETLRHDHGNKPNGTAYRLAILFKWSTSLSRTDHSGRAWTVFARSNTGIVGSNPPRGMDVCVYSVFVLFCV
jgi:hypothetical protein